METCVIDELELEVRLISGQLLAKVSCFRSEGLRKLRQRVKEACQIAGPFWLLQNQQMLRSPCLGQPDPLKTIEANAPLVLVKRSISDLSQELVGLEGAAFRGDAQEAFRLLDEGAEIDFRDAVRLRTPLMWAASGGHSSLCLELLKRGANPLLRASGANAAQLAQGNGHEELAQMLEREVERHVSIDGGYYISWQLKRAFNGTKAFVPQGDTNLAKYSSASTGAAGACRSLHYHIGQILWICILHRRLFHGPHGATSFSIIESILIFKVEAEE